MRESCTYGSVRGARGNSRPYRDRRQFIALVGGTRFRSTKGLGRFPGLSVLVGVYP
jgi:hypothetical protein